MTDLIRVLRNSIAAAQHKPGQWCEARTTMGGIADPLGQAPTIGQMLAPEQAWGHFSYKRDAWLAVAAVNALPKLMEVAEAARGLAGHDDALRRALAEVFGRQQDDGIPLPRTRRDDELAARGAA